VARAVHREWDSAAARKIKGDLRMVIQTIARYEPCTCLRAESRLSRSAEYAGCSIVTVTEVQ
jgi:hypothetical protein